MRTPGYNIKTTVNELTVSYNDLGPAKAPVLIFIHGFPLDKSMWNKQLEMLRGDYRVIAYDVRGHGGSESGKVDFSIDLFVHDLLCLMETLKISRAVLCGHSMGGYIALNAVERFPQRFEALILTDTQCIADTRLGKEGRIETMENILDNGVEEYAETCIGKFFAPSSLVTKQKEIADVRSMIVNLTTESLCNTLFALSGRRESCSKLLELSMPTLILVGVDDEITPLAAAYLMHSKIRGSVLAIIADAGHMANMENPIQFNERLMHFVRRFVPAPVLIHR